jgi:hypothetical protein
MPRRTTGAKNRKKEIRRKKKKRREIQLTVSPRDVVQMGRSADSRSRQVQMPVHMPKQIQVSVITSSETAEDGIAMQ